MASNQGRHRVARRTTIATAALGLTIAVGALVVNTTAGEPGQAGADEVDKSFFVDINSVKPNVKQGKEDDDASTGTFTVDCGLNENGHFNPDNFIAQPGIKNGAQHLHDYVGNLSTNADSNNKSLLGAGTTCENGDESAYFWPVVRIDKGEDEAAEKANPKAKSADADRKKAAKDAAAPRVDCPDVASELPDVPDKAMNAVNKELDAMEGQIEAADKQLAADKGADGAVLDGLKGKRTQSIEKVKSAIGKKADDAVDTDKLATCAVKDAANGDDGVDNGDENSDPAEDAEELEGVNENNELAGNDGEILEPAKAELTFKGNASGKVTAMPKFLRILYGDAKVTANGEANARASWTCSGFENRLSKKYTICPEGSDVKRVHAFPNCWDGKNTDSANHRTHIVFADDNGQCKKGFKAVPQLEISLTYKIPRDVQVNGQYKVDSFPEEDHNPFSDHDDFANVMSQSIMNRLVNCVNSGKTCNE